MIEQSKLREIINKFIRTNPADEIEEIDAQETREREEAAGRYAGEDESHFVSYCQDCIDVSVKSKRDIRITQKELYSVYNEEDPPNYANKEEWQSKVVIPKPHSSVQFAMSAVRKAFTPDFLSIENETNKAVGELWEKLMKHQLNKDHAKFGIKFTDATGMGFAVGESLEMIPIWKPGKGLDYALVEPWKIHRDPDALARQSHSGMYWIHQEYLDYHALKAMEENGRYINIDLAKDSTEVPKDHNLSKEEIARRKGMVYNRSKYRKALLTSEFWGVVLDSKGNLLLPNATFTVAGGKVISLPKESQYRTLRWPGTSFSPMPQFLGYGGRGLLKGVKSLWYFMCALLCLHNDNLNWVVNPMLEVDDTSLVDQEDIAVYPGKSWPTRGSVQGQQVVRTVERKSRTADVLANLKFADEQYQAGVFVNDAMMGRVGPREITARQSAQNLDQAMGVFGLMGENVEDGAINAIRAGMETVEINAGVDDLAEIIPEEQLSQLTDTESETGIVLPQLNGSFHVSGLSAILKDNETMQAIRNIILPLCEQGSPFAPYIKPYNILKSIETRTNLKDEGVIVTEEEAKAILKHQRTAGDENEERARIAEEEEALEKSNLHDEKMKKLEIEKENLDIKLADTLAKGDEG